MSARSWEITVATPIDAVWARFQDPAAMLPLLSAPADAVRIESVEGDGLVGTVITITARGPLGRRVRWVASIVEWVPPTDVVFGREARFVDVQDAGPFASWRHRHEFEAVDDRSTRIVDRITYRVGLGPLGWVADTLFVRRKLKAMFAHRHVKLLEIFGNRT